MKITREPAQACIVRMRCDCGGEYLVDEEQRKQDFELLVKRKPYKWPHVCNKCGKKERFDAVFPYVGYEEMNKK